MEDSDNYGEIEGEGWKIMTTMRDGEIEGEGWKMMTTMGRLRIKGGR